METYSVVAVCKASRSYPLSHGLDKKPSFGAVEGIQV